MIVDSGIFTIVIVKIFLVPDQYFNKMFLRWPFYYSILNILGLMFAELIFGPLPKIIILDGNLILRAAKDKNITLQTTKQGRIHIDGMDLNNAIQTVNSAFEILKRYQHNFESYFKKISETEQFFDNNFDLIESLKTLEWKTMNVSNTNSQLFYVVRRINSLNIRLHTLKESTRKLTLLLDTNGCISNPCRNGGTCHDLFSGFICLCPPEWEGQFCQRDVNECVRFAGTDLGCQNGATCINKLGSYECLCTHGWFGVHCTRRSVDCKSNPNLELCGHGTCVSHNDALAYRCICDQGWTTDGKGVACDADVDECSMVTSPCSTDPPVRCENLPGSFRCSSCPSGYSGNGYYCLDIDECETFNGGCSTNPMVQCVNTIGSRICGDCPPGYSGDGTTCSYIGICSINNGGCHSLATCTNQPKIGSNFVECKCRDGFTGSGIGAKGCTPIKDPCVLNPCKNGECIINGRNCEESVNPCSSNPCQNGATCTLVLPLRLKYHCQCLNGFVGIRCERHKQECGGRFTAQNGTLVYPSSQIQTFNQNGTNCVWVIETIPAKRINVTFKYFNLQTQSSLSCNFEWLEIHAGQNAYGRNLGRFCGQDLPHDGVVISPANVMYLSFHFKNISTGLKFELTWTSIDLQCGEAFRIVSTSGVIPSPGSPGNYPNNRDCYWRLVAPSGKRLFFIHHRLNIGNASDCNHDYLEFISGSEPTDHVFKKYCKGAYGNSFFSIGPEVLVHFHSDDAQNDTGFQINYYVSNGIAGCGGVFSENKNEIRSPPAVPDYMEEIRCEYKIKFPKITRIKLTFIWLSLKKSEGCQSSFISIHDGSNPNSPLIGRYCGSQAPAPFISENKAFLIVFEAHRSEFEGKFVLKYETVCGDLFMQPVGIIESPKQSRPSTCVYEIIQPTSRIIILNVLDLRLSLNSSTDCGNNNLEIRDGESENSTLIGRYCLRKPSLIVSTYNHLWIKFSSNSNDNQTGFWANYTSNELGCGGIMKNRNGTIASPNNLEKYSSTTNCKWILAAPAMCVVQIKWTIFHLEQSDQCRSDYVEIFDNNTETGGETSVAKYCGSSTPPSLLSTSNMVTVFFATSNINKANFFGTYTFIIESEVCGGNYFNDIGVIKSPGYPSNYPAGRECIWIIHGKPEHQILLKILDFDVLSDDLRMYDNYEPCMSDYLEIRNGGRSKSPLIGKYCGKSIPKFIPSHTNRLYLKFVTNSFYSSRKGFKIKWEPITTGCGGTLHSAIGVISSPNYPESPYENSECIWNIFVGPGSTIEVVFSDLDLKMQSRCAFEYVEFFDGPTLNSKSLGRLCSNTSAMIRSSSNKMTVKFRTDINHNGRGFELRYKTECRNTLHGFGGVIESPNFSNIYKAILNCTWNIKVATGNKINISFSHFDLGQKCGNNYLKLYYSTSSQKFSKQDSLIYYGNLCYKKPQPLSFDSDHVQLRYVTDNSMDGYGFRLEWKFDGCGGLLTEGFGAIKTPNYPKPYPPSVLCLWKIKADFGKSIQIFFKKIETENSWNCVNDYVQVFNGEDETYPEIARLCHQDQFTILKSTGNFMSVKFRANEKVQGRGFFATYSTKDAECGGKFKADKAMIMSPNYPSNYENKSVCTYLIEVDENRRIQLKFEDLQLNSPETENCSSDKHNYIKIYDGSTSLKPVLAQICGKSVPEALTSTYNTIYMEMVTQANTVSVRFLARYHKTCGARIVAFDSGYIRKHPMELMNENETCSWTITANHPSKHIFLTIVHLDCNNNNKKAKIFNGESPDAPLLGEYCGTKIPPALTSSGSTLHIIVNYDTFFFAIYSTYDSACGGILTSIDGYFASPGYPKTYPMNTECEWIIKAEEGNQLSLYFNYFELLESKHCNTDYLEIRESGATGKLLGTFCGSNLPVNITNVGSLWILLKTSGVEGEVLPTSTIGFFAEYSMNHQNDLSGPSGTIISPLYSEQFSIKGKFSWTVTVDFSKIILFTFKEIYLDEDDGTCLSRIIIFDGNDETVPSLGTFCGTSVLNDIKTTSNVAHVQFVGALQQHYPNKFILQWSQIGARTHNEPKNKTLNSCGTQEKIDLNSHNHYVIITSPGFPKGYNNNLDCQWIVTTIPMNHLKFYFIGMDLDSDDPENCLADYVEIFQKTVDEDWTSVIKACTHNVTFRPYIHASNIVKIVFKTNGFISGNGFSIFVREECGGILTEPNMDIVYDNSTRLSYETSDQIKIN